ncbi:MAG: prepilin-type cleavage/methylation domain-containing protein [Snowella sp.]|nr:prepilin-type cleavage/methylation domain-containing protein [Snowella sp.]
MTLTELLLGTVVAGIILQLAYLGFSWNRQLYLNDVARNDASQTFKTAFDIIGPNIQQAGEGLDASFPSILITPYPTNPPNPNPPNLNSPTFNSEITVRRLIFSIKLPICRAVNSGAQTEIFIADNAGPAGCSVTDNNSDGWPDNLAQWKDYRTSNGGTSATIRAFIYDGASQGEFLNYTGENRYDIIGNLITSTNPANAASLIVNGTLANSYTAGSAAQLLLIEERKYRLGCSDSAIADASCPSSQLQNLKLIVNNGTPVDLANKIGQFTVTATVQQDLTTTTTAQFLCWKIPAIGGIQTGTATCNNNPPTTTQAIKLTNVYVWSQIYSINVTLKAQSVSDPTISSNTQTTINNLQETRNFLPRNILNF